MKELFGDNTKFRTWRRLWIALARAEAKLGLPVSPEQIAEMERFRDDINYDRASFWEKKLRHDVMAHIHAYGEQCPTAMPVIHLGATSCFVGDNADILIMREALDILISKLKRAAQALAAFAERYKALPTLGFTHFQPAQLTTVGKRACLWLYDLTLDIEELRLRRDSLRLLGSKGTTGTQASFLELFDGDHDKVKELERLVCAELGMEQVVPVSGQTYTRKQDSQVLFALSGLAQSVSKFATDLRLLSHLKEVEEPFEREQVGSSAMPYKRNPMRSERMCALARYVITDAQNAALTAASQWFERTLDDSANRRIAVPEAFLAADALLSLYINVAGGLVVHEKVIQRRIAEELPFMASENILMDAVKKGGDRQLLHEHIRLHSVEAGRGVKERGESNDLVRRIAEDTAFGLTSDEINAGLSPERFIGRAPEQVDEFLRETVYPLLDSLPVAESDDDKIML